MTQRFPQPTENRRFDQGRATVQCAGDTLHLSGRCFPHRRLHLDRRSVSQRMRGLGCGLTAPGGYVAAGPGLVRAEDGRWTFRTRNQRDFALLLSKDYEVAQTEQNGICIRSFAFTEEDAQQALDTAAQALRLYSEWFGDYPYPDFTVCAADFYVGGMEYPALAIVDQRLYTAQDGMLEFVVARDGPSMVVCRRGQRPDRFPWQDEALAEYSTLLYYESVYGADSFDSLYQNMVRPAVDNPSLRGVGIAQELSALKAQRFTTRWSTAKGAAMLHDLRAHLGNRSLFDRPAELLQE